jgi:uncharacterized protein YjgD (DUF1641 family)
MPGATSELAAQEVGLAEEVRQLTLRVGKVQEQLEYLTERARDAELRQREWDDLRHDVTPVLNDVYMVAVEQLEALEPHVHLEDVLRLLTRLARNTRTFEQMLDHLESLDDFLADASPLVNDGFLRLIVLLDELERKGYFGFLRESGQIADRVVTSFSEDDVRQLGDNIVLILSTVKDLTQPEVMALASNLGTTVRTEVEEPPEPGETSVLGLVRQMRDPEVRRGLAMTLSMLKAMARQPDGRASAQGAEER